MGFNVAVIGAGAKIAPVHFYNYSLLEVDNGF